MSVQMKEKEAAGKASVRSPITDIHMDEDGAPQTVEAAHEPQAPARQVKAGLAFHPAADIFPLMRDADPEGFKKLVFDIKEHGVQAPITLHHDGRVIDGRNRYIACQALGIECPRVNWEGEPGTEIAYVLTKNVYRRHLSASQRSLIAARLATMRQGERTDLPQFCGRLSQAQVASLLNVSERSVSDAVKVLNEASPEILRAVETGEMSVSTAADQIRKVSEKTDAQRAEGSNVLQLRRPESEDGSEPPAPSGSSGGDEDGDGDAHHQARSFVPEGDQAETCCL
jgi:hypothetical protein